MKARRVHAATFLVLTALSSLGQGTFVYDQQSSSDETPFPGSGVNIQQAAPYGQSFTPALSSVGFVRLKLYDGNVADGLGATLYLNVRAGSISGTVLGSSTSVSLANNFAGTTDFLFTSPVSVTPGVTYYFDPVIVSGGSWNIDAGPYNYAGGTAFYQGVALIGSDAWFREGIIVPEPSSAALLLLGGAALVCLRR